MTTMQKKFTTSVVGAALAFATVQSVQASLIINFQFDSAGTLSKNISAADVGTIVNVQVWGTVLNTDLSNQTVGIAAAVFRAQSQQVGGGAFTTLGAGTFTPTSGVFDNGFVKGIAGDVNTDGVLDLGQLSAATPSATIDPKARAIPNTGGDGVLPGYYSDQGGWTAVAGGATVQLGTFKVTIGALGVGTTKFNVAHPTSVASASWFESASSQDGLTNRSPTTGTYSNGTSVSFVVAGVPSTPPTAVFKYALTTHSDATLGTANSKSLTVVGSNKNYFDPGPDANYVPANGTAADYAIANASLGIGTELPVLVLVDFNLGGSGMTMAQLETALVSVGDVSAALSGPGDAPNSQRLLLLSQYPTFNAATSILFQFNTTPGASSNGLHFGFDLTGSGVAVTRAIAVPEPASVGLLAVGAMGLMARRRKVC